MIVGAVVYWLLTVAVSVGGVGGAVLVLVAIVTFALFFASVCEVRLISASLASYPQA